MIISVVIPTYNRKGVLARTLPTVLEQNFPSEEFEVVVVVDGSSDGTVEMLGTLKPRCGFQVVEQTNRGPAAARNAGVATARGRLVLFLDDDIRSGRDLIAHHVSANENTSLLLVHGPILVAPESPPTLARHAACAAAERLHKLLAPRTQLALPEHADLVCNSSMPRSVFLLSGGFNATMPLQRDDCEFGLRLWKMGVQFQYEVGAIAYEFFVKSSRDFVQHDAVQCGKGEVRLCREHPEYRRYSTLATLGGGASVTRTLRRIALGPLPFEQSLVLPVSMCEQFQWISVVRSAGIRLLGFQRRLTFLRSASREAGSYTALQRAYGLRLPVLLYHNIAPEGTATTAPSLTLSPQQFDKQMRWLARRGYHAILPSQWLEWCRTGRGLPKKPVLLTFDDAYASLVPHALPVLAKLGFGAAVFVVTRQGATTASWSAWTGKRLLSAVLT